MRFLSPLSAQTELVENAPNKVACLWTQRVGTILGTVEKYSVPRGIDFRPCFWRRFGIIESGAAGRTRTDNGENPSGF